jgi:hypothetical protein
MAEKNPLLALAAAFAALPGGARDAAAGALAAAFGTMQRANGNRAFGLCRTCRHFRPDDAKGETGGPHRCGLMEEPLNEDETHLVSAVLEAFEATDAA